MRRADAAIALASCLALLPAGRPALAEDRPGCLSSGDASEAVTAQGISSPVAALGIARQTVPGANVLRASLCRDEDALVYRILVLRDDGRVVRVTVDAPSGRLKAVH